MRSELFSGLRSAVSAGVSAGFIVLLMMSLVIWTWCAIPIAWCGTIPVACAGAVAVAWTTVLPPTVIIAGVRTVLALWTTAWAIHARSIPIAGAASVAATTVMTLRTKVAVKQAAQHFSQLGVPSKSLVLRSTALGTLLGAATLKVGMSAETVGRLESSMAALALATKSV